MTGPGIHPGGGTKDDGGKPRCDLLPADALLEVAKVMTNGAVRYGDRNWEQGLAWGRLVAAALRHLLAWMTGQDRDPDSGLSHLAHAATCLLFLVAFDLRGIPGDDRFGIAGEPRSPDASPAPTPQESPP